MATHAHRDSARRTHHRSTLALCLVACRPPPPDLPPSPPPDALTLLGDRCDRGDAPACLEVAASSRDRGDHHRGLAYVTRACELASPRGCAELADALMTGDVVRRDPARALDLRVQSCLGGFAPACIAAAAALPPDQAAEFRVRACKAGDVSACPPALEQPPAVADPLDQAGVVLALAAHREALRRCYEAARVDRPQLRGRVALQIAVGPDGVARAITVLDGLDPDVDACITAVAAGAAYAPTRSGTIEVLRWHTVFEPAE